MRSQKKPEESRRDVEEQNGPKQQLEEAQGVGGSQEITGGRFMSRMRSTESLRELEE